MASSKKRRPGRLLAIGGAEDPDENDMHILPYAVDLMGGKRARVVVCGASSGEPDRVERIYRHLFGKIGVADVYETSISNRADADQQPLIDATEKATGIFLTGGDQLRLTSLVAGTRFGEIIRERLFSEGIVVAGTSAGAAAMSSTMIIGGQEEGSVRRADVTMAPGLGFWRDTAIDTHFNQRGRVHRLMAIFAQNPQVLGIGIDENTAIDVTSGSRFTVVGAGAVMVFNGRVSHSNAADVSDEAILALTDSRLHVLAEGYGFNLETMRPILPDGKDVPEG
jgi:cyanophycinase